MLNLLESRLFFLFGCVLFRIALDFSYVFFVNPVFSYAGFNYDLSIGGYCLSWLAYILCLTVTPHLLSRVSDYFLVSFLLAIMAPLSSITGLANTELIPLLVTASVFLFFRAFQHQSIFSTVMPVPHFIKLSEGRTISLTIAFISVFGLIFWYFYSGAFHYFNLDISKVYQFREASAELSSVGFFAYFNSWVYKVFSIFLMCFFLLKKNFFLLLLFFCIQVFFFGVSAHKAVLFYPVMVFSIWFYFRRTRALSLMPLCFIFIIIFCLFLYLFFDYTLLGSLFVRRVFFVPAQLTLDYFGFFSINDFVWWSNSIFGIFIDYPYSMPVSEVIGQYNGSGASANNGFISSGYGHAGLLGVALYSFIFAYFLKVLDSAVLRSDVPVWLALCMTIVPLRTALVSSDLFTTMLTHGLALSLFMVLLFRRSPNPLKNCSYKHV